MIGTKSKGFQRRAKSGDKRGEKAHKGKNKDTLMRMRQVDENTRKKGHTIEKQARVVIYLESSDIQYTNKAKCSSDRPVNWPRARQFEQQQPNVNNGDNDEGFLEEYHALKLKPSGQEL